MTRMTITTMVTMLPPLILSDDLPTLVFERSTLEKPRKKQKGDYHQDDHHQYVNQISRPHVYPPLRLALG